MSDKSNCISDKSAAGIAKERKRNRVALSCAPCRTRKLKCDRSKPCQNCNMRQYAEACVYSMKLPSQTKVQQRINRLESLVVSMAARDKPSTPETIPDETYTTAHIGSTHWGAVLQELEGLKDAWKDVVDEETVRGPNLLFGPVKPIEKSQLLATVPAKAVIDRLLAEYFDEKGPALPARFLLHKPTFIKEYEDYWLDPEAADLMWLGKLFSMLGLVLLNYKLYNFEPPEYEGISQPLSELYRLRTAQCLMMADITAGKPHTLEALMLNLIAEHTGARCSHAGVWMMAGVIVLAALSMGMHRENDSFSPFDAEMRRRNWCSVVQLDALSSFLVGLPSMIRTAEYDTLGPRNLYDWELSKDMQELPPSRPLTEAAPTAYLISKTRLVRAVGDVVTLASSLTPIDYHQVIAVDASLYEAHAAIPLHLLLNSSDSGVAMVKGIQLEFIYHQGMCVLHRKLRHHSLSRERCVSSATELLSCQRILYEQANGVISRQWFPVSFTSQDFILAGVVLCLEMKERRDEQMWLSVKKSLDIWQSVQVDEAIRVSRILSKMLESLEPVDESFMEIDWSNWDAFIEGASFQDVYDMHANPEI